VRAGSTTSVRARMQLLVAVPAVHGDRLARGRGARDVAVTAAARTSHATGPSEVATAAVDQEEMASDKA
jgi:hypothetical protein